MQRGHDQVTVSKLPARSQSFPVKHFADENDFRRLRSAARNAAQRSVCLSEFALMDRRFLVTMKKLDGSSIVRMW